MKKAALIALKTALIVLALFGRCPNLNWFGFAVGRQWLNFWRKHGACE